MMRGSPSSSCMQPNYDNSEVICSFLFLISLLNDDAYKTLKCGIGCRSDHTNVRKSVEEFVEYKKKATVIVIVIL